MGFDGPRITGFGGVRFRVWVLGSLLQQPGPKKFKLCKVELIYKAKKFKVPPVHYLSGLGSVKLWASDLTRVQLGVSKNRGYLIWGPYNRDPTIY